MGVFKELFGEGQKLATRSAQDILRQVGPAAMMAGGEFSNLVRQFARQTGLLQPTVRESVQAGARGAFEAGQAALRQGPKQAYRLGQEVGKQAAQPIRRAQPAVRGIFDVPTTPALRTPPAAQPQRAPGFPSVKGTVDPAENLKLYQDPSGRQFYVDALGRELTPAELTTAMRTGVGNAPVVTRVGDQIVVRPGGVPSLEAPTPGVRPPVPEAPGTTYRQTSLFSPADNEALQAFYQRGGLPRDISYKSKGGLPGLEPEAQLGARAFVEDASGRLVPSSSRIFPGEVEGQLPLNISTQIASRLSDAPRNLLGSTVRNLSGFVKENPLLATSIGSGALGGGLLAAYAMQQQGTQQNPAAPEAPLQTQMGPTTESADAGGLVNDPQAAQIRQAKIAREIAAGMSPGARATLPEPRYRGADGQTVIVQRGQDEGLTAAKQQYVKPQNALAAAYARRQQYAESPANKAQIISQLAQRGILDTPELIAWAGENPTLAYDLLRKVAGGGTLPSQQVPQPMQKVITASAGSNNFNNMIGNTAATAEATLGGTQGSSDLRGFTAPQLSDEIRRLDPALIYALQGLNLN